MTQAAQQVTWPGPGELRQLWTLDPAWTYLNHGGYGACPQPLLDAQQHYRQRLERQPINFMVREVETELEAVRQSLGQFLGAEPANLALITNATEGVNTVLRSLRFQPDEEIVLSDHSYPSIANAVQFVANRWGARAVEVPIPFPLESPAQALEAIVGVFSPRTRLLVIDHVASPTGLILPLAEIIRAARERDIEVLVDGAHAPGMLPLDLESLGATYYTGNCHKWMCTPKGAAFLWVCPECQEEIVPLSISLGWLVRRENESRFLSEFKYTGTWDPSAQLTIADAISFFRDLPGGWPEVRRRNHALLVEARDLLCAALSLPAPAADEMLGSLATIPLPPGRADALEARLTGEFRVEVPIIGWPFRPRHEPGPRWFRISAQVYNRLDEYQYLADCLQRCLAEERS